MLNLEIKIDVSQQVEELQALHMALSSEEKNYIAAEAIAKKVRDHIAANFPLQGPRGNFWERVHDSVEFDGNASGGEVSLWETGTRLRYEGGEVTPGKNRSSYSGNLTKALAVPSKDVPVNSGRQVPPSIAGVLAFLRNRKGNSETIGYLVEGEAHTITRGKNKGKEGTRPKQGGNLLYTLRAITRHTANPNVLPSEEESVQAAIIAFEELIESQKAFM